VNLSDFQIIGNSLAQQISNTISKQVLFEPSGKEYQNKQKNILLGHHHFRVPQGKYNTVPAWISLRKTQNRVKLNIRGDLLPKSGSIVASMQFKPNANYKSALEGGVGEWTISIYSTADINYQIALNALIVACRAC
jgi:hypothetical protein